MFKFQLFLAGSLLKFAVIYVGTSETRFHYVAQAGFKLLLLKRSCLISPKFDFLLYQIGSKDGGTWM